MEIIFFLLIILILLIVVNIRIVPQSFAYVVERIGVYYQTWGAGLNFKIPFIDRVASRVSLKEQIGDFPHNQLLQKIT